VLALLKALNLAWSSITLTSLYYQLRHYVNKPQTLNHPSYVLELRYLLCNTSFPRNIRLIPGCCGEIKNRNYWRKQEVSCVYEDPVNYTNLYQIRERARADNQDLPSHSEDICTW